MNNLCNYLRLHKSIVMLNGKLPPKSIVDTISQKVVKISADGAGLSYNPDFIIGDMDSIKLNSSSNKFIKIDDQSTTDFEKCLNFIKRKNLSPVLVIGISGGEIDHFINNMMIFMNFTDPIYFLDYSNKIKFGIAVKSFASINITKNSTVSILTFSSAIISTKGLKWDLEREKLAVNGFKSVRNKNLQENIEIIVHKGKVLLIVDLNELNLSGNIN